MCRYFCCCYFFFFYSTVATWMCLCTLILIIIWLYILFAYRKQSAVAAAIFEFVHIIENEATHSGSYNNNKWKQIKTNKLELKSVKFTKKIPKLQLKKKKKKGRKKICSEQSRGNLLGRKQIFNEINSTKILLGSFKTKPKCHGYF